MQPIETFYNGYRFRSRLEARWAVFMSTLFVPFEYEKEGFVSDGQCYLPDFYLPNQRIWLEVKPHDEFSEADTRKMLAFERGLRTKPDENFVVCAGEPWSETRDPKYAMHVVLRPPNGDPEFALLPYLHWAECPKCGAIGLFVLDGNPIDYPQAGVWCNACCQKLNDPYIEAPTPACWTPRLKRAYEAARSARFA